MVADTKYANQQDPRAIIGGWLYNPPDAQFEFIANIGYRLPVGA